MRSGCPTAMLRWAERRPSSLIASLFASRSLDHLPHPRLPLHAEYQTNIAESHEEEAAAASAVEGRHGDRMPLNGFRFSRSPFSTSASCVRRFCFLKSLAFIASSVYGPLDIKR